ncbi:xanthine dehydrogenase family protein subunit M [Streptomyces roseirectus]|uniref:Xanthine dehydrogenase family protein subunit M n=1 Tax=Streptomyces roseirectus TaxID=2768066 RepID=A0A7H0IR48_9ACTN|nr:xanthine dehydrogenase family protein subunit M [Streptomyces roseirectus]QNP75264.1 xanthine dehydrogenase family protein subunit M [Streptomyces roseirectus]
MKPFDYTRTTRASEAVRLVAARPQGAFVAGGTELLNLVKDQVVAPDLVVDISRLPLSGVELRDGTLRVGALARMREVADHADVRTAFPVLAQALLASASPQIRNRATIGGNLMQRTRCWYYRDAGSPCNKRAPGSGCPALTGQNRRHAIHGGSGHCIAVHPSDLAVALTALRATVIVLGPQGTRAVPLEDFYLLPGTTPHKETALRHGELITEVTVPASRPARHSRYLKLRDRATFEFAVVSVAAALTMDDGEVSDARLAFGGIAPRPWRSAEAEEALRGRPLTGATIESAARALLSGARPRRHNAFKAELVRRALADVLTGLGGGR